ncbi:MAG: triosephosphate isomerase [Porticoccaceae bacterium]|nr:MAG: triosephosphate isomerase [Porticoccaceae bacterium]
MRAPLVVANWKMHGSARFVDAWFAQVGDRLPGPGVRVAALPPFVYLAQAVARAGGRILVGAQDLCEHAEGAYTGEVSAAMLADVGCALVVVGHSERRRLYGEDDRRVAAKFAVAQAAGLLPVLCVGETAEERARGETLAVVRRQLSAVAERVGGKALARGLIAYEPVWAIGSGETATPAQAQEVHAAIRAALGPAGERTTILYGGSVNPDNAPALFAAPDVDGALVGGASLDPAQFVAICHAASEIAP